MARKCDEREQIRAVERKLDRAKNNLIVIHYDLHRSRNGAYEKLKAATIARDAAQSNLNRLLKRQKLWETKRAQHETKIKDLKQAFGMDD